MPLSNRLFASGPSAKLALITLAFLTFGSFTSCSAGKDGDGGTTDHITISGDVGYCPGDSMRLYQVLGPVTEQIASGKIVTEAGKSTFTIDADLPEQGLYSIGTNARQAKTFLLGDAAEVSLTGNCQNPSQSFAIAGSALNDGYQNLMNLVITHNQKLQQLQQNMQIFQQADPAQIPRIQQEMQTENTTHAARLDSILKRGDIVSKYASLYNFQNFGSKPDDQTKYGNPNKHFQATWFDGLDLNDPVISKAPQLFEKAQYYAMTLSQITSPEDAKASLFEQLSKAQEGTSSHQSMLKGYLSGLEQRKSDLYVDFGEMFVAQYPNDPINPNVKANVNRIQALMVGNVAPNISSATPEGGTLALEELRGKVVMIDFWASWCRPCRAENPNVVKAYNKYSSAGFEILGVSLDKDKNKWLQAIAADGLTWKHISDLGGWGSQPAAAYGVNSIPATFLLDRDGKIIAKNLRGPALENKLAEIFGY